MGWARELARPLPLSAVALLALNDHVLKHAHVLPGWLTGKLSDVAGLFFFPIFLFALVSGVVGEPRAEGRVARASLLAGLTAAVFAAIKLIPACNELASTVLGPMALDPTDLLACPLAAASVVYLRLPPSGLARGGELARRFAVALTGLASMATTAPRFARSYPHWEITGGSHQRAGCSELTVEIVKSGKTGLGAILSHDQEPSCDVHLDGARVRIAGTPYPALSTPAWDESQTAYVGFAFDNEALWNDGVRDGSIELDVTVGGQRATLVYPMTHAWSGTQEETKRTFVPAGGPP